MLRLALLPLTILLCAGSLRADPPEVVSAHAEKSGMGWRIEVTLRHDDTGWDHYADGWEVLDEAGNRIGLRKLHHPHVNEQPFTRSLPSVMIPDGVRKIFIVAHCSKGDARSEPFAVELDP